MGLGPSTHLVQLACRAQPLGKKWSVPIGLVYLWAKILVTYMEAKRKIPSPTKVRPSLLHT